MKLLDKLDFNLMLCTIAPGRGCGVQDPQVGLREPRAQPALRARGYRALLHDLPESRLRSRRHNHSRWLEVMLFLSAFQFDLRWQAKLVALGSNFCA